jgi:superfamily II DNA or RNA helicase
MILDRIILCDQTSQRLEKYSIPHGVLQAGHWRFRPYENIQICSAQTLEKRGDFPDLKLLVVDECHTTRAQTVEFIKNNPDIKVIGLTATPFTKGLGKIYDGVISTITTKELVDQKVLVPLRVFIAKEIDMTDAKKVAGEWSAKESTTRGMKITGDIVAEWVKKTHEIFGKARKTIVFCSGVNHGADLAKKFADAGYNFISISYKDDDQFKADVIEDFAKPDTEINGLIATDILTKGFDVSDVMIGISARPFSKSLSSHIQQMGRVMRGMPHAPEEKPFAVWLDHSGNYLRFQEDWDDVYNNGVHELDEGREKTKKEKTDKEKKESCCPRCAHVWQNYSDVCLSCGFVRERKNQVEAVAGELHELKTANKLDNKQDYWSMCQFKIKYHGWNEKRALAAYKTKFGVWPKALHKEPITPSDQFERDAKASLIRYLKGKKAA